MIIILIYKRSEETMKKAEVLEPQAGLNVMISCLLLMITRYNASCDESLRKGIAEHFLLIANYPGLKNSTLKSTCAHLEELWSR
jgi:hypothetical protein